MSGTNFIEVNVLICVKGLYKYLAHSKCNINASCYIFTVTIFVIFPVPLSILFVYTLEVSLAFCFQNE